MIDPPDGGRNNSIGNVIEEQLNNISLENVPLNLENDPALDESLGISTDESSGTRRNSSPGPSREESRVPSLQFKSIEPLQVSEVRWFYKERGSKRWRPFNGHDTINIETLFRSLPKETRESGGTRPSSPPQGALFEKKSASQPTESPSTSNKFDKVKPNKHPMVLVLGGLYEADLVERICLSIYWPGEEFIIIRGTWFYNSWEPLDEESSTIIEDTYLELFQGKSFSSLSPDNQFTKAIRSCAFPDFNIDWYSPHEVYLYSKAASSQFVRSFTQKIGYFKKSAGAKIHRGYKALAKDDDKPKEISHLVFVVHGVGQKMNIGAAIFSNTISIRERVSYLQHKYFPDCEERVEFFPVEWRSNLVLDGGTVDEITPMHIKYLRQVLNTSAMDIMYYTSPLYCGEIQSGVVTEMNRLYSMFLARNPHITPKVSVIAHSLGAVIVYDVVTGWKPMSTQHDMLVPGRSRLHFRLENFFCLGSPLAVFLALRVPKGHHGYHLFPPTLCNRLYNIYHLTDPVAYRLEPIVAKDYTKIAPLPLHPYNAVNPIPYSEMNLETEEPEVNMTLLTNEAGSTSPAETPSKDKTWSFWNLVRGKQSESGGSPHHMDSPSQESRIVKNSKRKQRRMILNTMMPGGLEHRLDYVLTSGAAGPLVVRSVLISHTAYWSNNDVAFFLLTRIFPDLEIQRALSEKTGRIKRYREKRRDKHRVKKMIKKHPKKNN